MTDYEFKPKRYHTPSTGNMILRAASALVVLLAIAISLSALYFIFARWCAKILGVY